VFQCRGHIRKQLGHFLRRAQVLILAIQSRPIGIGKASPIMNANTRFVSVKVVLAQEPDIVRGNHGDVLVVRKRQARPYTIFFSRTPCSDQLEIESVRKYVPPAFQQVGRFLQMAAMQRVPNIAVQASR
jgi:predicted transcriptional regulator